MWELKTWRNDWKTSLGRSQRKSSHVQLESFWVFVETSIEILQIRVRKKPRFCLRACLILAMIEVIWMSVWPKEREMRSILEGVFVLMFLRVDVFNFWDVGLGLIMLVWDWSCYPGPQIKVPFIFGDPCGFQTINPNQQFTISWCLRCLALNMHLTSFFDA